MLIVLQARRRRWRSIAHSIDPIHPQRCPDFKPAILYLDKFGRRPALLFGFGKIILMLR